MFTITAFRFEFQAFMLVLLLAFLQVFCIPANHKSVLIVLLFVMSAVHYNSIHFPTFFCIF